MGEAGDLVMSTAVEALLVEVALLPSPASLPDSLTYRVPAHLEGQAGVGMPAIAPLGGRELLGYIVAAERKVVSVDDTRLRSILAVPRAEPAFDDTMLALLRWVAREYGCHLSEALPLAVPERYGASLQSVLTLGEWDGAAPDRSGALTRQTLGRLREVLSQAGGVMSREELEAQIRLPNLPEVLRKARTEGWVTEDRVLVPPRVQARKLKGLRVVDLPEAELEAALKGLGPKQREVMDYLWEREGETVLRAQLYQALDTDSSTLARMVKRGLVEDVEIEVRRAPRIRTTGAPARPTLNPPQQHAVESIDAAVKRGKGESLLLYGITGSGKTEVYLHAIERVRESGRTAILLVPEISLTAQVAALVRARLGERVAILHSALSEGERFDEWERLRRGEADVVVGPRSALFAPLRNPALIILDEEHDGSYKEHSRNPRYHARKAAQERARLCGGAVVLGSATPSIETFHAARGGDYELLELPKRATGRGLPAVEIVDLRLEGRSKGGGIFGPRLMQALHSCLSGGEQAILFLNRRGYSAFVLCRDCGHVPRCPSCEVSLTLHRSDLHRLVCHHCDHQRPAPESCERCFGARCRPFGLGTQRVEDELRRLLPKARIARLDRDTTSTKDSHQRILTMVQNKTVDILIGTQMVTKGFDFPGVTLVGVVTADVALNVPDFRAGERAFQLLTQVSGRAGRGERAGRVIVQTFSPEHPSVVAAARHDYLGFFEGEIGERESSGYPPFGTLARLVVADESEAEVEQRAETVASYLRAECAAQKVSLLGPAACALPKLRDRYRWNLLLKGREADSVRKVLDVCWPLIRRKIGGVALDVDPVDLL